MWSKKGVGGKANLFKYSCHEENYSLESKLLQTFRSIEFPMISSYVPQCTTTIYLLWIRCKTILNELFLLLLTKTVKYWSPSTIESIFGHDPTKRHRKYSTHRTPWKMIPYMMSMMNCLLKNWRLSFFTKAIGKYVKRPLINFFLVTWKH